MSATFPIRMLNGVGVVASKKRSIDLTNRFDSYFPKPHYSDPLLIANGSNEMTIDRFIPKMVREYQGDTAKIAEYLKQDTLEKTCRAIFDFVYKNIQYTQDEPHEEQIRRPARTWADRVAGVDCDCYTTFISSILYNLRIPHYLRMAAYNPTRGYQHIYVIVPKDPNNVKGSYWTIDPVLDRFNDEKSPQVSVHDKLMQPIGALNVSLNGFPIRAMNGGMGLRSPLVYSDVLYSPLLGTWALQGVDGGIYIEGDYNQRYVEPLDGVGLGFIDTALSIGKGIFSVGKKIVGKIKDSKAAKKVKAVADKVKGKAEEVKGKVADAKAKVAEVMDSSAVKQIAPIISSVAPDSQLLAQFAGQQANTDKKLTSVNNNLTQSLSQVRKALEEKATNSNNATVQSIMQVKKALEAKSDAQNKANVISLQSIDKSTKEKISEVVSELDESFKELANQGASAEKLVNSVKDMAQAALMNTVTLNKKDEERAQELEKAVEKSAMLQAEEIKKQGSTQKFVMVGIAALGALMLLHMLKGNKH